MPERLSEPLYEIENWRGGWYYKLGSRYTGPFERRASAVDAARAEIDPILAPSSSSLRASLASQRPVNSIGGRLNPTELERQRLIGMAFPIPGNSDPT